MGDPLATYLALLDRLDAFTARVERRYPGALACRPGCADCCGRDLSLFPFEVERLVAGAQALPAGRRRRIGARARQALVDPEAPCPLLEDGLCLIYPRRPVICRTHGLVLLVPGERIVSLCPHSFRGVRDVEGPFVLDLTPVNQILAGVHELCSPGLSPDASRRSVSAALAAEVSG